MNSKRRNKGADAARRDPNEGLGLQLENLRRLRGLTQVSLADAMEIGQTALSHLERRDDILVSSLKAYIAGLGGELHIAATFPDGDLIKLLGTPDAWSASRGAAIDSDSASDRQLALPEILRPKQSRPSRDVVFSIRPTYANKIFDGVKTVELRRRFAPAVKPGTLAFIYSTSPTSALTGSAKIRDVQCLNLSELWNTHCAAACLGRDDFETYFSGLDRGYAIVLESAKSLDRPVGLTELRKRFGFEPPQSYQYASPYMRGLVEHEWPQAPH